MNQINSNLLKKTAANSCKNPLGLIVIKILFCILAFILTWDNDAASNSPTLLSSGTLTNIIKPRYEKNFFNFSNCTINIGIRM